MTTLLWVVLPVSLSLLQSTSPLRAAHDNVKTVIAEAIEAMGGDARIREMRTVKIEAVGHSYLINESERPEGPWITQYEQRTEIRDFTASRLRRTSDMRSALAPSSATLIVADATAARIVAGKAQPARPTDVDAVAASLALGPERILFTARDAPDVTLLKDELMQGVRQQVVEFTWKQTRVRLLLNAYTKLPTAIERTHDDPLGIWGEITDRTLLSFWNLESNGLLYPRQWNMEWNSTPIAELTISNLTPNPAIEADAFAIPAEVRDAFARAPRSGYRTMKLGQGAAGPQTLADGVIHVAGPWNVTLVQQTDGLVVIEAPISSEYSAQVLDEAARRFPGVRVKAVISTSDSWPHISGLREYVARGIPVYALDLNEPIITRLLRANYRGSPDRLARAPGTGVATPQLRLVSDKTTIGDGLNRLVIYPIHGENGERMLMVHAPERRLLYTSDDIIKQRSGEYFMPSYLVDLTSSVTRAGITGIDTVFGMHLAPTPWTDILAEVRRLRPPDTTH